MIIDLLLPIASINATPNILQNHTPILLPCSSENQQETVINRPQETVIDRPQETVIDHPDLHRDRLGSLRLTRWRWNRVQRDM